MVLKVAELVRLCMAVVTSLNKKGKARQFDTPKEPPAEVPRAALTHRGIVHARLACRKK